MHHFTHFCPCRSCYLRQFATPKTAPFNHLKGPLAYSPLLIQLAGGDERSSEFQSQDLPGISRYVNQTLGERSQVDDSTMLLDTTLLKLQNASDVRVYFVGEGAGYHNTLGLSTTGQTLTGDAGLLFPDASVASSRRSNYPVKAGDYVNAGEYNAGTALDFFLIANGAYGGKNTYWSGETANPDGINHMVALAVPESPYLIIGFEDLYGGGDRDFNDLVFAVDIGEQMSKRLSPATNQQP